MFKPKFAICSNPECGKERIIATKDGFCQQCRYEKVQAKKSQRTSGVTKLSGTEKTKVFSSLKKKFREPSGELQAMKVKFALAENESELSRIYIKEFSPYNVHHILHKAQYKKFRTYLPNLLVCTKNEHDQIHNGTLHEEFKLIIKEKAQQLKQDYFHLHGSHQQKIQNKNILV